MVDVNYELSKITDLIQSESADIICEQYIDLINKSLGCNNDDILGQIYKCFAEFLFDNYCYEESLDMFIEAHYLNYMKDEIEEFIYNIFINPNKEHFYNCYNNNILQCENGNVLLKNYPYDSSILDFIPITEDKFYIFDNINRIFKGKIDLIKYSDINYLQNKYIYNEFSDIIISEDWNYEKVRKYLNIYKGLDKKLYIISSNLNELLSFLKISPDFSYEVRGVKFFDSMDQIEEFFIQNKGIYLPHNIISEEDSKKDEIKAILLKLHNLRLTSDGRDEDNILLSICIPSYNRGHRALQNIQELLNLPYDAEVEFIVSDNGSEKNIEGYKEIYNLCDARVKYYNLLQNEGFAKNVMNVISKSKGKFCLILSDEDSIIQTNLAHYLRKLKINPDIAIVAPASTGQYAYRKDQYLKKGNEAILGFMLSNNYISGIIYNKKFIEENNLIKWCNCQRDNIAYMIYPHMFIDIWILQYGYIYIDSVPISKEGIAEKSEVIIGGEKAYDSTLKNLAKYSTYTSRLEQHEGWSKLIKEISNGDTNMISQMYIKLCNKTFHLCYIVKNYYIIEGYKWTDITNQVYDKCLEYLELLYDGANGNKKGNDKKQINIIKVYYEGLF